MYPQLRYEVVCGCGEKNYVALLSAGTRVECVFCKSEFDVPTISELKGGNQIDVTPLGRLCEKIRKGLRPFDGTCQICDMSAAPNLIPVNLELACKNPAAEYEGDYDSRTVLIPCVLCDFCKKDFRKGLFVGYFRGILNALLNAVWLLLALIAASIVAFILPLIGVAFVLSVVSALFYHLTRRRANPYLLAHLDKICGLKDVIEDVDQYSLKMGANRRTVA